MHELRIYQLLKQDVYVFQGDQSAFQIEEKEAEEEKEDPRCSNYL